MYSDYRMHLQDKIRTIRWHYLERRLARISSDVQ
jgi:hypothetical protein